MRYVPRGPIEAVQFTGENAAEVAKFAGVVSYCCACTREFHANHERASVLDAVMYFDDEHGRRRKLPRGYFFVKIGDNCSVVSSHTFHARYVPASRSADA